MRSYSISPIQTPEERQKTREVAKRVFGSGASPILPKKPSWGFYAHEVDEFVGGVFIDQVGPGEGQLSWIFVDSSAQGHKLGARLLESAVKAMDDKGLKTQFALVRGDNTASWNMFAKHGYKRPTVIKALFGYSLKSFFHRFQYSLITGYNIWVKDEARVEKGIHPRSWAITISLLFALFIGMALSLFSLRGMEFFFVGMAVVTGISALRILVAYPMARMFGPVRFDAPQGGTPLSVLLALVSGSWWPTFGFFVPKDDIWHDHTYNRYNGLQAFVTWMSLLLVYGGLSRLFPEVFNSGLGLILTPVIVYQALPFFPFDGLDGAKVIRYSKVLYGVGVVATLLTIVFF
ncbi:MAG: GNAT family N-acetyltransferase [Spirochaetales bacterium]|nr:GNAT family N-acetyltransferase [Spirochaetales bacterium]